MNVKFDVNEVLQKLAEGLGVAVENLYPILYKQAIIDGVISLLGLISLVLFWIFIYKFSKGFAKKAKEDYEENGIYSSWFEHIFMDNIFLGISGFFFCAFTVIMAIGTILVVPEIVGDVITAFFNTEYHMIENILNKLK